MKQPYVYILASKPYGTLYVGVTSDLIQRIYQHRSGCIQGFTKTYKINQLVYFEECGNMENAISREKTLKKWRRDWKIDLIEKNNPHWDGLYPPLTQ